MCEIKRFKRFLSFLFWMVRYKQLLLFETEIDRNNMPCSVLPLEGLEGSIAEDLKLISGNYNSFSELRERFNLYDYHYQFEEIDNSEITEVVLDVLYEINQGFGLDSDPTEFKERDIDEISKRLNDLGIKHFRNSYRLCLRFDGIYFCYDNLDSEEGLEWVKFAGVCYN